MENINKIENLLNEINKKCGVRYWETIVQEPKEGVTFSSKKNIPVDELLEKTVSVFGIIKNDVKSDKYPEPILKSNSEDELIEKLKKMLNKCFDPII